MRKKRKQTKKPFSPFFVNNPVKTFNSMYMRPDFASVTVTEKQTKVLQQLPRSNPIKGLLLSVFLATNDDKRQKISFAIALWEEK